MKCALSSAWRRQIATSLCCFVQTKQAKMQKYTIYNDINQRKTKSSHHKSRNQTRFVTFALHATSISDQLSTLFGFLLIDDSITEQRHTVYCQKDSQQCFKKLSVLQWNALCPLCFTVEENEGRTSFLEVREVCLLVAVLSTVYIHLQMIRKPENLWFDHLVSQK